MEALFQNAIIWIGSSKYILLFFGTLIEGPVVMVMSGFLFRLGQFDFVPMYLMLVFGDFVADLGWYAVGYFGARPATYRYGKFLGITPEIVEKIERRFKKYQDRILIISKLTMGFGFALVTLVVAGMLKVSFKRYALLNFIGGFFWTLFLLIAGYFFGNIYLLITPTLKVEFLIIGTLVIFLMFRIANRRLKKIEI